MFESAKAKIKRAEQHIADFNGVLGTFLRKSSYTISSGYDPNANFVPGLGALGAFTVSIAFKEKLPEDLGLILGDALHNLRGSLDHATWELIGFDGGTQNKRTALITKDSQEKYEVACNALKTPRADTKEFFTRLAIYPDGLGETLYHLHLLNNADKHVVITPVVAISRIDRVEVLPVNSGRIVLNDCAFSIGANGVAELHFGLLPGGQIHIDENAKATI